MQSLAISADSLLDQKRISRERVTRWLKKLIRASKSLPSLDKLTTKRMADLIQITNNFSLILYLTKGHAPASKMCNKQIEFALKYFPALAIQPNINLIRLDRYSGNLESALTRTEDLYSHKDLYVKSGNGTLPDGQDVEEFLSRIYLSENFLTIAKIGGPEKLGDFLLKTNKMFPNLHDSAIYAERCVMAGITTGNDAWSRNGLNSSGWSKSPHYQLVRSIYLAYWNLANGDKGPALTLSKRIASLNPVSLQWRDHALARILMRCIDLAARVDSDDLRRLNMLLLHIGRKLNDVHITAVALHREATVGSINKHAWQNVASTSGYPHLGGLPHYSQKKRVTKKNEDFVNELYAVVNRYFD